MPGKERIRGAVDHALDSSADSQELVRTVRALARRVAELEANAGDGGEGHEPTLLSDDEIAAFATALYRSRQYRTLYFDPSLFAEPAWDMLLDLFINTVRGVPVATTSLCLAANVPQATGLRWIGVLQKQGLVRRHRSPDDARLKLVAITPKGFLLMRQCISDCVARFKTPEAG